jgi:hypothetical protein
MPRRKHVQSLRGQTNFKVTNHQPKASANYRWLHSLENIATNTAVIGIIKSAKPPARLAEVSIKA